MPIIGATKEEAEAKHKKALEYADPVAGLAQFSGYTGVDISKFPIDEPINLEGESQAMAIQACFKALAVSEEETKESWTPRRLGMRMAMGGLHPCPVGTAAEVADVMQQWVEEADVDGFNVGSIMNPGSWTDVVDLLVPELQSRGLYWLDYAVPGGTFRENLLGSKTLRDDNYGSTFKWGTEKAQAIDKVEDEKVEEEKTTETKETPAEETKETKIEAKVEAVPVEVEESKPIDSTVAAPAITV